MARHQIRWTIALVGALLISPAEAQQAVNSFDYGVDFMRTCERPRSQTLWVGCTAYARGLRDMAFLLRTTRAIKDVGECPAAMNLSGADVLGILVEYLRSNPEYAAPGTTWETPGLYWLALSARYPCWAPAQPNTSPGAGNRRL